TIRQILDELLGVRIDQRVPDLLIRIIRVTICDIVAYSVLEKSNVLTDDCDVFAQIGQLVLIDIDTIEENHTVTNRIEPMDEAKQRRFTAAGSSYHGNHLARLFRKADTLQYILLHTWISEGNV